MFKLRVPAFSNFLLENLMISNWRNYKDDTDLSAKDSGMISEAVLKAFEIDDPSQLIFTSNDTGLGEDYMFFTDILRSIKPIHIRTLNMPGYIVYISAYDYEGKRIVSVDVMNNENYSFNHIFIKNSDFEFFSPNKQPEVQGQQEQMDAQQQQQSTPGASGQSVAGTPPIV